MDLYDFGYSDPEYHWMFLEAIYVLLSLSCQNFVHNVIDK